jgi:uncharacterized membrane protein YgaE (UPF0421/DUF939 family)
VNVESFAIKDLLMLGTILVSVGSSFAVAKFQIGRLEKNQEKMNDAINAIGKKLDAMKNEFTENKTICDKEIAFLKKEVEHFDEHYLTRKDIENFVTKEHCESKFKEVVPKSEFELTLQKIDLRFKHLEEGLAEVKKDTKEISETLKDLTVFLHKKLGKNG